MPDFFVLICIVRWIYPTKYTYQCSS